MHGDVLRCVFHFSPPSSAVLDYNLVGTANAFLKRLGFAMSGLFASQNAGLRGSGNGLIAVLLVSPASHDIRW